MDRTIANARKRTYYFLLSRTGNADVAADLTQDAFLSLFRSACRKKGRTITEAEFVLGFEGGEDHMTRAAMKIGKGRWKNPPRGPELLHIDPHELTYFALSRGVDPGDEMVLHEFSLALTEAYNALPENYRMGLRATLFGSTSNTADAQGVDRVTIWRWSCEAVLVLQRQLKDWRVPPRLWTRAALRILLSDLDT